MALYRVDDELPGRWMQGIKVVFEELLPLGTTNRLRMISTSQPLT